MNALTAVCFAAALAAVVCGQYDDESSVGYGPSKTSHGSRASGYGVSGSQGTSGYGGSPPPHGARGGSGYGGVRTRGYGHSPLSGGYGRHNSFGYGGYGRFVPPPPPPPMEDAPPNELDKLQRRIDIVREGVKAQWDEVNHLAADLSIQEKTLMKLKTLVFEDLMETDHEEDESLDKNDKHLEELDADSRSLYTDIYYLMELNSNNTDHLVVVEGEWAMEQQHDTQQSRDIYTLDTAVRTTKAKLFQVKQNSFDAFSNTVDRTARTLKSIKTQEKRRMCETGVVTIYSKDAHQVQLYNSWFGESPQILWGISGFLFNREDSSPAPSYGPGYGYPPPPDPEALGLNVYAYSTKTGIHFQLVDYTFGATSLHSVDVKYQACTLGPGAGPVDH